MSGQDAKIAMDRVIAEVWGNDSARPEIGSGVVVNRSVATFSPERQERLERRIADVRARLFGDD